MLSCHRRRSYAQRTHTHNVYVSLSLSSSLRSRRHSFFISFLSLIINLSTCLSFISTRRVQSHRIASKTKKRKTRQMPFETTKHRTGLVYGFFVTFFHSIRSFDLLTKCVTSKWNIFNTVSCRHRSNHEHSMISNSLFLFSFENNKIKIYLVSISHATASLFGGLHLCDTKLIVFN